MASDSRILVLGGGISSLIFGRKLSFNPVFNYLILERRSKKEDMKTGFLYFHSDMSDLKIDLDKFEIYFSAYNKGKFYIEPNPGIVNAYSLKTIGYLSKNAVLNISSSPSYGFFSSKNIAFKDLFGDRNIVYGKRVSRIDLDSKILHCHGRPSNVNFEKFEYQYLVSTISLPLFLKLCCVDVDLKFESRDLYLYKSRMKKSYINQCIYVLDEDIPFYRFSCINGIVTVESNVKIESVQRQGRKFFQDTGYDCINDDFKEIKIPNGRFLPVDARKLKTLFREFTDKHNVFFLGRNATWSYKRSDHISEDGDKILEWIEIKEDIEKNSLIRKL